MNKSTYLSLAISAAFCAPALAQPPGGGGPGGGGGGGGDTGGTSPTDTLQQDLDLLTARVEALETSQDPSVAGRSYCSTFVNTSFRGDGDNLQAETGLDTRNQFFIVRRVFNFYGDNTYATEAGSVTILRVDSTGRRGSFNGAGTPAGSGTYLQSFNGRSIDIVDNSGIPFTGTYNVSGDGSMMIRNSVESFVAFPGAALASGLNTFVEIDPGLSATQCPPFVAPPANPEP